MIDARTPGIVLLVAFVIALTYCAIKAQATAHSVTIHERISLSRTCPNGGRWYLDESDSDTAMLICTYSADDDSGDGPASQ